MRIVALEGESVLVALDDYELWKVVGAVCSAIAIMWGTDDYLEEVETTAEDWGRCHSFYADLAKYIRGMAAGTGQRSDEPARDRAPAFDRRPNARLAGGLVHFDAFQVVMRFSSWQLKSFSRIACLVATKLGDSEFDTIMDCNKSHVLSLALEFQRAADLLVRT